MSTLLKLIQDFARRTVLPVEVDDVVAYLRSIGIKDEIYFFDADMDTEGHNRPLGIPDGGLDL